MNPAPRFLNKSLALHGDIRNFAGQHVVAADGFDFLFLGFVVIVVAGFLAGVGVCLSVYFPLDSVAQWRSGMLVVIDLRMLRAIVFGVGGIVGMGGVFRGLFVMCALSVMKSFDSRRLRRNGGNRFLDHSHDGAGLRFCGGHFRRCGGRFRRDVCSLLGRACFVIVALTIVVIVSGVIMRMIVVIVMCGIGLGVLALVRLGVAVMMLVPLIGLRRLRGIEGGTFHRLALDAVAMAAAAGIAVARAAAVAGAVLALFFRLAVGAFVRLDQRLTVGDRDLIVVVMDFAEGEKTVAVAAIFDEGRLQRRLYARDFCEIDIAAQLFALGGLEIKFFDAIAANHDNPGLLRMGRIDQHFVGHFGTHDGGGRVWRCAHLARPGDATVHLIRG